MPTEFVVSTRIIFWGDKLDPLQVVDELGLDRDFCWVRKKGDLVKEAESFRDASYAKTGAISYAYDRQHPESCHHPEEQFAFMGTLIGKFPEKFFANFHIEEAQLQVFVYYELKSQGEPDFVFPASLIKGICKHRIDLRVSVLP